MLPDRVSNPGPMTYESDVLPTALCGQAAVEVDAGGMGSSKIHLL